MDLPHLVSMANSIGDFFAAYPDRTEAADEVANHIARFWEPRMRRAILAALDTPAVETMQPLVADALRSHRDQLLPTS